MTSNIEIVDGKTIITYCGTAVSIDGEMTDIYREIVLDFVVSKDLQVFLSNKTKRVCNSWQ